MAAFVTGFIIGALACIAFGIRRGMVIAVGLMAVSETVRALEARSA